MSIHKNEKGATERSDILGTDESLVQKWGNLQTLFDSLDDLVSIVDAQGVILKCNVTGALKLGYGAEELEGKSVLALYPPELRESAQDILNRNWAGEGDVYRLPLITKGGKPLPVETKVSQGTWNKQSVLFGVSRDVSRQMAVEQTLKQSEQRLQMVLEGAGDAFWDWEIPSGKVVFSQAWATMLGYAPEEITPDVSSWEKLVHPEDAPQVMMGVQAHLKGQSHRYQSEHRLRTKTGEWKWILDRGQVVQWDANGAPLRMCGTHSDISLRKQAEQRLSRLNTVLLELGFDHLANIQQLTALCGELLAADCALYNRLDGSWLSTIGSWQAPPCQPAVFTPEGHLCYDVIRRGGDIPLVVRHLPDTAYAITDPNVLTYGLKTYVGCPVKFAGQVRGSLCVVYAQDFAPTADDLRWLGVVAAGIAGEEARAQVEADLQRRDTLMLALTRAIAYLLEDKRPEERMDSALAMLGKAVRVDRVLVFEKRQANPPGIPVMYQRFEWNSGANKSQLDNPAWQHISLGEAGCQRWYDTLLGGGVICGCMKDFPVTEWPAMAAQGIQSLLLVPIIIENKLWGMISFGDCHSEREWTPVEIEVLRGAASAFGNAFVRIRIEQELHKLSTGMEQSPVSIVITNGKGEIEYANSRFTETTGYALPEVLGKNCRFLKTEETPAEQYRLMWQTIMAGKVWRGELLNRKKSGEHFWEQASISPIFNHQGKTTQFLAVKEDITQRKLAEQQILESLRRAQELANLKNNFISLVSHEFRTPLGAILSASELLDDSYERMPLERRATLLKMVKQEVWRLAMMMEDILALGRLDSGTMISNPKSIAIKTFSQRVAGEIQMINPDRAPVVLEFQEGPEVVFMDEDLLHHVLSNLLTNAYKYSPNNTAVELIIRGTNRHWSLVVKDHGIGIPNPDKAQIFSAFYRGTNVGKIKGTGVGLYILKKCVEICQGSIRITNNVAGGTVFLIRFPWVKPPPAKEKKRLHG